MNPKNLQNLINNNIKTKVQEYSIYVNNRYRIKSRVGNNGLFYTGIDDIT